jgi:hypothetical protein
MKTSASDFEERSQNRVGGHDPEFAALIVASVNEQECADHFAEFARVE